MLFLGAGRGEDLDLRGRFASQRMHQRIHENGEGLHGNRVPGTVPRMNECLLRFDQDGPLVFVQRQQHGIRIEGAYGVFPRLQAFQVGFQGWLVNCRHLPLAMALAAQGQVNGIDVLSNLFLHGERQCLVDDTFLPPRDPGGAMGNLKGRDDAGNLHLRDIEFRNPLFDLRTLGRFPMGMNVSGHISQEPVIT